MYKERDEEEKGGGGGGGTRYHSPVFCKDDSRIHRLCILPHKACVLNIESNICFVTDVEENSSIDKERERELRERERERKRDER